MDFNDREYGLGKSENAGQLLYLQRKLEDLERAHRDEKRVFQDELGRLQQVKKEQMDQIMQLKKKNEIIEKRYTELKKTAVADQAELKSFRHKMRVNEQEREKLAVKMDGVSELKKAVRAAETKMKEEIREREKKITDKENLLLEEREKHLAMQTKFEELQLKANQELETARASYHSLEERFCAMDTALRGSEAAHVSLRKEHTSAMEANHQRIDDLQTVIQRISQEYGRLASNSIALSSYETLKSANLSLSFNNLQFCRKLANAKEQANELVHLVRHYQDINEFLVFELRDAESHVQSLNGISGIVFPNISPSRYISEDLSATQYENLELDFKSRSTLAEVAFWIDELYHLQSRDLLLHYRDTTFALTQGQKRINELNDRVATALESESRITQERNTTQAALDELKVVEAAKIAEIKNLSNQITVLKSQLDVIMVWAKGEVQDRETALEKERNIVRKLMSTTQQNRMAEEGLRADISRLSTELDEAEAFKDAYGNLIEEVNNLVARNELAEIEAERLSKLNAKILGHRNPTQKIYYVDKIRRELADTKQKLLLNTRRYDAALDEITALRNELSMYKSIAVAPADKPRTTITRIIRTPFAIQDINSLSNENFNGNLTDYLPPSDDMTVDEII